jgi:hypothetical protein
MLDTEECLKGKILNEMMADYKDALEKNFELAKKLLRITTEGKVIILDKEKLNGKEQILLYLIGKFYAKEGSLSQTSDVSNKELMNELGIPVGSVLPWTKDLRDTGKIKQISSGVHQILPNLIEKTLNEVHGKLHEI